MDTVNHGGDVFDSAEELPPVVTVGGRRTPNAYANALVKHVVFSDSAMAMRWQTRIATLRGSPVSRRSTPVSA